MVRNQRPPGNVRRRSRRGCLVCRVRKKPCSGPDPDFPSTCAQCRGLHIECLGFPGARPNWMREPARLQRVKEEIKHWTARRGSHAGFLDLSPYCGDTSESGGNFQVTTSANLAVPTPTAPPASPSASGSGSIPTPTQTRPRLHVDPTFSAYPAYHTFQHAGPSSLPIPSTGDTLSPEHARRFSHHNRSRSTSAIPTDRSGDIPQSYTNRPSTSRGYRQQSDEFAPGSTQETSLNMTQNTTGIPEVLVSPAVESDFPFDIQRYLNINGESESWRSDTSSPSGASSVYSTPLSGTSDPAVSPSSPSPSFYLLNVNVEAESWRSDTSSASGASSVYSTPLSGASDPVVSPSSPLALPSPSPSFYLSSSGGSGPASLLSPDGSFYSPASSTSSLALEFSNTTLGEGFRDSQQGDAYIETPLGDFTSHLDNGVPGLGLDFGSSIFRYT